MLFVEEENRDNGDDDGDDDDGNDDDDDDDFLCRKEKRPFRSVGVTRLYLYTNTLQHTTFYHIFK